MFARLFAWFRRHPRLADFLLTLPILLLSGGMAGVYTSPRLHAKPVSWPAYAAFSVALWLPMIWRRRAPRLIFAIVALTAFAQWLAGVDLIPGDMNLIIALYTVAAECALGWAIAGGMIAEFGAFLAVLRYWVWEHAPGAWGVLTPFTVFVWAIWIWGRYISTRRKYTRSLEERAERLERERDAQAQIAAAAERARIAREMHDVIAHSVSVMVVQADGAGYMVDIDPARARRAMETIGATGRQALAEMRRMLGLLREEDDVGSYAPQPGIEQLTELVEQIRSAGLPVGLTVEGVPSELPAALQLAIYRIVQEALTNTRKHAGPDASAQVRLHYGDDAVEIHITDDGRGAAAADDGRGHGLVGMNERVALFGGRVRTGPRPGGGYEVWARLPVPEPERTRAGAQVA